MLTATAAATAAPPSPLARKKVKATRLVHLDMFQPVGGLNLGQPVSFVNGRKTLLLQLAWAAHTIHNIMSRASLACIHSLRKAGVFLATDLSPSKSQAKNITGYCKLQKSVYDILPPTSEMTGYVVGFSKLLAEFFCLCSNGRMFVTTQATQIRMHFSLTIQYNY